MTLQIGIGCHRDAPPLPTDGLIREIASASYVEVRYGVEVCR